MPNQGSQQITCWRFYEKPVAQTKWNPECKEYSEYKVRFSLSSILGLCSFLILQDIQACVRSRASREGDEILTMWLAYVQLYDTDYHDKVVAFDHGIWSFSVPGQTVNSGGLWQSWGYMHSLKFRFASVENSNPVLAQLGFQANWHLLFWPQNQIYSILKIFAYIC